MMISKHILFWIYGADVFLQLMQRLLFTLHLCGNSSAFNLTYGNAVVTILAKVKKKYIKNTSLLDINTKGLLTIQEGLTVVKI